MSLMKRFLVSLPFLLSVASCGGFLPRSASEIHQAIWVTRFDYASEGDVREIIRNCAKGGFDTVLFQVRGNGTTFYPSRIEPWAAEFGWKSPGFDPLDVACDEAKLQGISLQAWVNAVPGWRGERPPENENQLFHKRPGWFCVDSHKRREPLRPNGYVMLNPCLPEVRAHVASICEEIASHYPVDGVHLDYIRFADRTAGPGGAAAPDYPYDDRTLELFRLATGKTPDEDPKAWYDWRTDQVTAMVREIRRRLTKLRRRCMLTAAVFPTPRRAHDVHQDWVGWLANGYVDAVFPMTYDSDNTRFQDRLRTQAAAAGSHPVIVGIGVYKHKTGPAQTLDQMTAVRAAGLQGYALFAYSSFYRSHATDVADAAAASRRRRRRERILPRIQSDRLLREPRPR